MEVYLVLNTFCACFFYVSWWEPFLGPQDLKEELVQESEALCRM